MIEASTRGHERTGSSGNERAKIKPISATASRAIEMADYDEGAHPGRMFLVIGIAGVLCWSTVGFVLWLLWDYLAILIGELDMDDPALTRMAGMALGRRPVPAG